MKKKVQTVLLALAVSAVSCTVGFPALAEETASAAAGGNIVIAETADPQNVNPLFVVDQTSFDMQQALYSPFFEIVGGEMYYENGLCESVTVNDDASEFTLKLKDGLKWHDGEAITADDVVFTMEVLVDESQNVPYASYGYVNDTPVTAEKVDDLTVNLKLGSSSAGFLGGLSQVYCIPKHIYEGVANIGESELNNTPIGSGPFQFEEYKSGEYFKVVRFDDWFNPVNLDSITYKIVKDSSSANAALASGDLDARLISADDYAAVSGYDNVTIYSYNSGRVNAMFLNELNADLQDVSVRQAISYALNKEELCQFAFISEDYADPAYSLLTPDTLYYTEPENQYNNDPVKAQELLAQAGKTDLSLNLMYISTDKTMESEALYIQSSLANVGITINLLPTDESTFKNKTKDPVCTDYDLVLSFYTLGEEPSLYADMCYSESRSNYSRISDADLDALWDKANMTADAAERGEIYSEIQNKISDNMYIYPIAYSNGFYAVNKKFGGFEDCLLKTIYYDYSKIYLAE
ncbi:MAG: ABC transporter substrate-binding protein [Lachnospiraceae bacterium]|nr:ABC transporter substrate-binding protein [Lachnospiraceae bacterium]